MREYKNQQIILFEQCLNRVKLICAVTDVDSELLQLSLINFPCDFVVFC